MPESSLPRILKQFVPDILREWVGEQTEQGVIRPGLIREPELRHDCQEFLELLIQAVQGGNVEDVQVPSFEPVREMLERLSRSRGEQGFTPSETAMFVFSLKRPLFARLRRELERDPAALFEEIWRATALLDKLGLFTTELYQRSREEIIARQQQEMLELSTPVVKLWEGILALPLIGTLDSNRTQVVMESLLERIVETGSEVAIIDITGVPTVDTLVAQHLLKTVSAAQLMGVQCIISGIRPQIAQTIVHLAIDLSHVLTKASLADAFRVALSKVGLTMSSLRDRQPQSTPQRG